MTNPEYVLFGIENPLLDISAAVNEELLAKYSLKANDAILAEDQHKPLFKELVEKFSVEYNAAGAAQNTMRGAQWLMPPKSTVYVGCVGKDANAQTLKNVAQKDGLRTEYLEDPSLPTGVCAVLITKINRSMVTDLLAANAYKMDHLKTPEVWGLVQQAKVFYVGGYFLTVCPPAALLLAEHALETNKTFTLNLSAPFIPQFFKDPLGSLLPYTDILFGNETEACAFSESMSFGTQDLSEIALKTAALPKKNSASPRIVVFTQGAEETIVAVGSKIQKFAILPVATEKIVDTTGAGDAFVGGFLSQLAQGAALEQSIAAAHYVASIVIQRSGPSYPDEAHAFKFAN